MRKFLTLLTVLLLSNTFLITPAQAVQEIVITEPTHRLSDGVFFDDELATKLNPTGELGLLIYSPSRGARSWLVDPATLSEIVAMSNGYVILDGWEIKDAQVSGQDVAKAWLAQLLKVSRYEKISVLTYGNPSRYWVDQLFEKQITYINASGEISLEGVLGKATTQSAFQNGEKQDLSKRNIDYLKYAQRQIDLFSTLVDQKELLSYQLRISQLLNPDIEKNKFQDLINESLEVDIRSYLNERENYNLTNDYALECIEPAFYKTNIHGAKIKDWTNSALKCFDVFLIKLINDYLNEKQKIK